MTTQGSSSSATRPLRVLCFCEKWESGGIETFITTLYECMDRSKVQIDLIVCKAEPGPYDDRLAAMGIAPQALGTSIRTIASNLRELRSLLAHKHYDVAHLNIYQSTALAFAREARKAGVTRVIVHSHNNDLRPSPSRQIKLLLHRVCAAALGKYADLRWAPSKSAGQFMFGSKPFDLVRNGIAVKRFAFDPAVRADMRKALNLGAEKRVIGCVGRLCEQKNQLFLLDALAELDERHLLLIVGKDDTGGIYEKKMRQRVCELGLEARALFYGASDNIAPLYQAMDILCIPSTFEALGIVSIEAQAAGLPVLASTAVPHEAKAGGDFTQIPLNASAWASTIADKCNNAPMTDRTNGATAVVRAGYDMVAVAAEVLAAYRQGIANE